jgi:hypothetical protein
VKARLEGTQESADEATDLFGHLDEAVGNLVCDIGKTFGDEDLRFQFLA